MLGLVHEVIDQHASKPTQKDAKTNGEEDKSGLRNAEGVGWAREDIGEGGEEEEEDAERESGV